MSIPVAPGRREGGHKETSITKKRLLKFSSNDARTMQTRQQEAIVAGLLPG